MAVALEKFVQQLEDSGILAGDTLKEFLPPKGEPKDAEALALELVRKKKLTKFQAEEVSKGKGKSLVLGNYVLMEKIGAGGMGQVFKARHRRMDRLVAVKLLPAAMTKDGAAIARFEREVKAAAKLRHPNIVAADDADQANGVHFLVMELVEGSDLSALVKKNGPCSVVKAVKYVLQAAKGLEFAHKKGVVHRDIKPANLLLDAEETVKILDMGLARLSLDGDDAPQADLTSTGTIMGTVDYMAPEQALDTKTADARADIYALGCSLYFMLTGKPTYDGDTLMKKLLAHREQPIPSLRSVRAEVPEQLETVFRKMVAKKIEERYQTMTEVIAALESCGSGQSNTVALQASDDGPTILLRDKSASSRKTTLPPPARESVVKSNTSPKSKSVESSKEANFTDFLDDLPSAPTRSLHTKKPVKKGKNTRLKDQKKLVLVGAAVFGVLILFAGVIFSIKSKDGKLIVTVNEQDAQVEVLNEEGKLEITRKGEKGPITVSVVPGKHQLKVQKDGFELFTDNFVIKSGNTEAITAKLVPLEKPAAATSSWHGWPTDAPRPAVAPFDAAQAKRHQQEWANYLKLPVEYTNSVGMKFVLIPPGEFTIGSTPTGIEEQIKGIAEVPQHWEGIRSEAPQHKVVLTKPFYLGDCEVTQKAFETEMNRNPSFFAATGDGSTGVAGLDTRNHPVERVSWNDATEFCSRLSQKESLEPFYSRSGDTVKVTAGTGYRLPTNAEWEFACRAGTETRYWCGDDEQDLLRTDWIRTSPVVRSHPVGELKSNPLGLFDVHGNVYEWVYDRWEPNYYSQFAAQPAVDPEGPSSGFERVYRVGDWYSRPSVCQSSGRRSADPNLRDHLIGFRMALPIDAVKQSGSTKTASLNEPAFQQWNRLDPYWKITPQQITASTGNNNLEFNTFLCSPRSYRDFELTCQVWLKKGNSGIQIRSEFADQSRWILKGPQVDIGPKFWGSLYGEQTIGMMQEVPSDFEQRFVKPDEFNDVSVRCVGKHVTIKLNGQTSVDRDFPEIADEGFIGLQLHSGEAEVVFRNVRLTEIKDSRSASFNSPALQANDLWITFAGGNGPGQGKHVVLVSGDEEYRSEEALPQLAKILSKHHGFKTTVLFAIDPNTGEINPKRDDNIPGLEALKTADLMIIATRHRHLPDEQMKYIADYVEAGKPVIGMRTATHAFTGDGTFARYSNGSNVPGWSGGFGKQVLGEQWVGHHGNHGKEGTRGIVVSGQESSPILRGIEPGSVFSTTDVYTVEIDNLARTSVPILLGEVTESLNPVSKGVAGKKNNPMMPVAWTKLYKTPSGQEARVFCTTMGAATDLEAEGIRRMLVNATYWTLGLESQIPERSNVNIVGEFKPSRYEFNGYVKGKKPADYAKTSIP